MAPITIYNQGLSLLRNLKIYRGPLKSQAQPPREPAYSRVLYRQRHIEVEGSSPSTADFPSVETLAVTADHQLFVSIASNPYHILRRLYHEKEACGYNLRTRPHNFALSVKDDTNFVSRSLYAELKS